MEIREGHRREEMVRKASWKWGSRKGEKAVVKVSTNLITGGWSSGKRCNNIGGTHGSTERLI